MQGSPLAAAAAVPRLATYGLACRRGDRVLLRGISFALEAGEALHLQGANGIGKSSLLRILAGLAKPAAGIVEIAGTSGLLDDRAGLDPELPLERALGFWMRFDDTDPHLHEAALERLGLAALRDVPVGYLSAGQIRRAAFVRLLCQNAGIWLLDEPLNGLDAASAALAQVLVSEHCDNGGIVLIASHQPIAMVGLSHLDLTAYSPGIGE